MSQSNHSNTKDHFSDLNALKDQVPKSGFDGLNELLSLTDELESLASERSQGFIDGFLEAANEHLQQAPNSQTVAKLLDNFKAFATDLDLGDDDWRYLQSLLLNDDSGNAVDRSNIAENNKFKGLIKNTLDFSQQATQQGLNGLQDVFSLFQGASENTEKPDIENTVTLEEQTQKTSNPDLNSESGKFTNQIIQEFIEKTKAFSEQASNQGLSGLLDILLLIQDWCENHAESSDPITTDTKVLEQLFIAINDYLAGNESIKDTIDTIFLTLEKLDDSPFLEQDEIHEISTLLLEEAEQKNKEQTETKETDIAVATVQASEYASKCQERLVDLQSRDTLHDLSGVQDLVYLLVEWLMDANNANSLQIPLLQTCENCIDAIENYLNNKDIDQQIENLMANLGKFEDHPIVDSDDLPVIKQVLIDEAQLIVDNSYYEASENENELNEGLNATIEPHIINTDINQVPQPLQEFVSLLLMAFEQIVTSTYDLINKPNETHPIEHLDSLSEHLEKFSRIAETADFKGLHIACDHMLENLQALKNQAENEDVNDLLHQWIVTLNQYLNNPTAPEKIQTFLLTLCSPSWPIALNETKATELLTALQALEVDNEPEAQPERQKLAQEEDVSLQVPEDVAPELVESLLSELPEQTAAFSSAIAHLEQGGSLDDVIVAQRAAHTLKGAGNTVGVRGIANLTHHLEDILTALVNLKTMPNATVLATLQRASDCLEEIAEALTNDTSPPDDAQHVLQEILDLAGRIDHEGVTGMMQHNDASNEADKIKVIANSGKEDKENAEQMLRIPASQIDRLLQFSDELMIVNGQLRGQLRNAMGQTRTLQAHLDQFHTISEEMLDLVDKQSIQQLQTARADNPDFDSLEMDQYNELYSTSRRLHEMTSDSREMQRRFVSQLRDIDALIIDQGYLNQTSQDQLLKMRMIPVNTISSRLQRSVRQASRMTEKPVNLAITGMDLLVDRDILNGILDPMMHLLRNAVDHGIESQEQRIALGKPEQGQIKLNFRRDKNMIVVECTDDGAGLNLTAIRNKAIKLNMIDSEAELSDEEIKQLIMLPNFSTQENVSHISGRGVGMDAVDSGIRALGGTLRIDSESGKGCHFTIQLPMSLAHYNNLLVKIGKQTVAIAELGIEQILLPEAGQLVQDKEDYFFEFDGKRYAVKAIESLLSRVQPDVDRSIESKTFLLLKNRDQHYAIAVESVLNVKEMVVKDLDVVLPKIHGVIGASLLDDGSIASVLDLQELLQQPARWGNDQTEQFAGQDQSEDLPHAMVVDDSLSARRSLEQFFSDMGYQIMPARDGMEAIELLDTHIPDIVITDLEMPRVNGIELTDYLRRNEATKTLPVVMITSRATAKHKKLAVEKGVDVYLTKPYSEEELSRTVMDLFDEKKMIA